MTIEEIKKELKEVIDFANGAYYACDINNPARSAIQYIRKNLHDINCVIEIENWKKTYEGNAKDE